LFLHKVSYTIFQHKQINTKFEHGVVFRHHKFAVSESWATPALADVSCPSTSK